MTEWSVNYNLKQMPKIVDKKEKKAQILEVAIQVFASKGVNNTTIAEIALAANIGKGTVYEYFTSKDEIFSASFHFFMAKIENVIFNRINQISDPLEKLIAYFSSWGEIMEGEYLDYLKIVLDFWAASIRNQQSSEAFDLARLYEEYRKIIEILLDECIAKEKISPVDTKIVASIMLGSLDGLLIQWIADSTVFNIKEAMSLLSDILIKGLKIGE